MWFFCHKCLVGLLDCFVRCGKVIGSTIAAVGASSWSSRDVGWMGCTDNKGSADTQNAVPDVMGLGLR